MKKLFLVICLLFSGLLHAELPTTTLLIPNDNSKLLLKTSATFSWEKIMGVTKYRLIFSNVKNFSNYDANKNKCLDKNCFLFNVNSTSYKVSSTNTMLKIGGNYFWQVQALNKFETSEITTITTENGKVRAFSVKGLYTKIANNGTELFDDAKLGKEDLNWACTKDNKTGLIWEIKTNDSSLRDMKNVYTWYDPDKITNGGFEGYFNDGYFNNYYPICKGSYCDTFSYQKAINSQGLCGSKNWRIPTIDELAGIFVTNLYTPYFPYTSKNPGFFWSSTTNPAKSESAYGFNFNKGVRDSGKKFGSVSVRLVH